MSNAVFKSGETTRIRARFEINDAVVNLVGKTLKVKAQAGNGAPILLTSALEVQSGATLGWFWFEATPANLATLGNPEMVTVVPTAFNADNTIFMDCDPIPVAVEL